MTYPPHYKGKLKVDAYGNVYWNGNFQGQVASKTKPGATSPKGMVTNKVWFTTKNSTTEYQSMLQAVETLLPKL